MAVRIRLARFGAKKKPYYRIVAADREAPRDGRFLEQIGSYDPSANPPAIKLDLARYEYWRSVGGRATSTVASLARKARNAPAPAPVA